MSLQQYNALMSNLLKEKHFLAKLREELERKKGKLCFGCKGFGHLAQNCRKQKETEKGVIIPQNKFEVLKSKVMQCGVEERIIKRVGVVEVECFKYGEKGHKCRESPLWARKKKVVHVAKLQKVHQQKELVYSVKGVSQTSFSYISINSLSILIVLRAMGSSQKDLLIDTSHILSVRKLNSKPE